MSEIVAIFRGIYKIIIFLFLAISYFSISLWIDWTERDDVDRRKKFSQNACRFAKIICKIYGLEVIVKNPIPQDKVGLIVGNHLGFVDILAVSSLMPNLFVTSKEMHETPFLGHVTEFGGCVYVERRSRKNILKELEELIQFLRMGFRVCLYPEATSHNAEEILPFKRTLMTSAAYAGVPILPYVFNIRSVNGEPFTMKYRDSICYWGGIPFHISIWRTMKLKKIVCEVEFLGEVWTTPEDNRAEVADRVRQMIVDKFDPVKP